MSQVEKLARDLRQILNVLLFIGAISLAIAVAEGLSGHIFGGDDTDSLTQHSGMSLHTDFGTGCQYLESRGSITPRLGSDGHQICGARR